ncbi:MAG: amidohydrolase [Chloroflexi bacterium]|nr:amidohydrolase [Chloroflexota bacterium]
MIFDIETYYAPKSSLAGKQGFALLQAQLDEAGVDRAVLFPMPDQLNTDNEGLRELIAQDPRFIAAASMNPNLGQAGLEEFRIAMEKWGFRGLKLMPVHYAFRSASTAADPLIAIAREFDVPVTIHSGNFFCHPLEIAEMASRFPDVTFIMDHMGYRYYVLEAILAAERCPNIYLLTTAVFEPHFIRMAIDRVGADRVVYGSNAPLVIPRLQLEVIRSLKLSPEDEDLICGKTAARIYKLEN